MAPAPGDYGADCSTTRPLAGVAADPARFVEPSLDEHDAAAMCYTSGTTGRPKGVLYSHRAIDAALAGRRACAIASASREDDIVLPIVPMFHVNAWGLPFTCTLFGATPGVSRAVSRSRAACSTCSSRSG